LAEHTSRRDEGLWEKIEARYKEMILEKGGEKLSKLDDDCDNFSRKFRETDSPTLSKEELLSVVEWKFLKGKPRYALMNHLKSNGSKLVEESSSDAFKKSTERDISGAITSLCELKGVGPATASAILSLHSPDLFAFMDDEIIECLFDGKRAYTLKIYLEVNSKCFAISQQLGKNWSPRRVGRALWTAARIFALTGEDPISEIKQSTEAENKKTKVKKNDVSDDGVSTVQRRVSKRRKVQG